MHISWTALLKRMRYLNIVFYKGIYNLKAIWSISSKKRTFISLLITNFFFFQNIFHGAMSLDQLFISRPSPIQPGPFTPIHGLFLCGSGAHPGGGVMGAAGRLAAQAVLSV